MSGLEVIGGISAIISLLDASIKIYDSARNDIKLSATFEVVRRRLPVLLHILETCKNNLESRKDAIPEDVCEALERCLDACDAKASNLRGIFEKIIPGESDTWEKRYLKVLRKLGKGSRVEELMRSITEDVQVIVNHNAVRSGDPQQKLELENIIQEMNELEPSVPDKNKTMTFHSGGGAQTNNLNTGGGQQINNNAPITTQNFGPVTLRYKEDFSFRGPVGINLGQAPYIASELFVGRGLELDEITKVLCPNHKAQRQQRLVLGGMGGIGKTQLAIAYAESVRGSYSSVFWLNAVSEAALKDSFRSIAGLIFDIEEPGLLEDKQVVRRVHQWLCTPENTGWLLIFDNYDDLDQFQIDCYYPPASHGAIVVTSRRPDHVAGTPLHIKPLQNVEDSLAILQTRSKRENVQSDPHAKRLAERLAGLPLALATAGTYLQRSTFTFERYLKEYEKRWNINPRRPLQLKEYQERTLYTTWDLSYSALEKEDPDAAKILKLLAYFDNQRLWYELFHAGITESSPEWLREVMADDVNFAEVMGVLAGYYFLDVHQISDSWSMHNCVHDWTLAALNKDVDAKHYWYAFDCISASINDDNADGFVNRSYSPLAAHATRLVLQRFCQDNIICNIAAHRLDQASRIAELLRKQVRLLTAEQMYQRALAGYEKALGPDHTSTLGTVHNLGLLYSDQGKLKEAEEMYQRALAGKEKAVGPDHMSTLSTVHNLGNLYSAQGKLKEAEEMYQQALAGKEKAVGPDHTSTLSTVHNLGLLYSDQGKLKEAEEMYQRALVGKEKSVGPDHTSTLSTVHSLGLLYKNQGKLKEAEEMYQQALAGYEKALGPDHTSTLSAVHSLGLLYKNQGKLKEAEEMYQRALAGYEKALSPDHTSTLSTVHNLGNLYSDQGKLKEAEEMYQQALAGYEKALGPDHTSTLSAVHNLGNLYKNQGKLKEAEEMYQRALAGFKKALGPDHTSTLSAVHSLGLLYKNQGKLKEAEEMYQRALAGYEKALGPDHMSTLSTVHNLGKLYSDQGKLKEAEEMYQRALAGKEKSVGPDHTSTLSTIHCLGLLYSDQGKLKEAEEMYQRALAGYEKALGPDHTSTLSTVHNLGLLYSDQGKLKEAEEMYQRALAGFEKALGPDHMSTLSTVHNLGLLYKNQGKLKEAEEMYQ
ncbi:TPR repeat protein [Aspergillus fischeri NRRL 181]|uniref:TPR repeat protein n=1 Tax=Neosartorya fischeri (strain ATCC 1020 / DSM 3700 / CBS 544.65 / FGSC A1164 / JCM 1740 / NRRL 181 / WB 181) TaxID=331117 RepID=A1DJ28_NEOFI|nr:TPR repeat protein [Aspergillus fischeri NRRL 181]EAW19385.1 TPR repeat protein [Aspergillus fischeri NRRL 181]